MGKSARNTVLVVSLESQLLCTLQWWRQGRAKEGWQQPCGAPQALVSHCLCAGSCTCHSRDWKTGWEILSAWALEEVQAKVTIHCWSNFGRLQKCQ